MPDEDLKAMQPGDDVSGGGAIPDDSPLREMDAQALTKALIPKSSQPKRAP